MLKTAPRRWRRAARQKLPRGKSLCGSFLNSVHALHAILKAAARQAGTGAEPDGLKAREMHRELEGKAHDYPGMNRADQFMRKYFKNSIELVKYRGPVQMCVFYLEDEYVPLQYKITIECERKFTVITAENKKGEIFSPWMIYPEADYAHFKDKPEDVEQLVKLTCRAITKQKISFCSTGDLEALRKEISQKNKSRS